MIGLQILPMFVVDGLALASTLLLCLLQGVVGYQKYGEAMLLTSSKTSWPV
jgi:hypothetical protein